MLLTKILNVKANSTTYKYYNSLGYNCRIGDIIEIKVEDLKPTSGETVLVKCDYCGKEYELKYRDYNKVKGKTACTNCKNIKTEETNMERYGCKSTLWEENTREKINKTFMDKYGYENPMKNQEIINKRKDSCVKKYGVDNPMKVHDIRKIHNKAFININGKPTSKNQRYIAELFDGEVNYKYENYFLDIFFPDNNIYIEYNGGGHNFKIMFGLLEYEKYEEDQMIRYNYLKENGLKAIIINHSYNILPEDNILLSIKKYSFDKLKNLNISFIIFDIDNKKIKTESECIDFDYKSILK